MKLRAAAQVFASEIGFPIHFSPGRTGRHTSRLASFSPQNAHSCCQPQPRIAVAVIRLIERIILWFARPSAQDCLIVHNEERLKPSAALRLEPFTPGIIRKKCPAEGPSVVVTEPCLNTAPSHDGNQYPSSGKVDCVNLS